MTVQTRDFLKRRRDRALGTIMGHLERSAAWDHLDVEQRRDMRERVIEALNSYHDVTLDLLKAEDDVARNDYVVGLLERIASEVRPHPIRTHVETAVSSPSTPVDDSDVSISEVATAAAGGAR